jgi:thymidylate kinase
MPPPVLVTISGMVGAGKSSGEGRIVRLLRREGVPVVSWRFRTLPCFSFPFGSSQRPDASGERPPRTVRGRGYKRRPLTLGATAGYLGRMAAFRIYRRWRQPAGWTLCNRYFYDSLTHFDLDVPEARKYLSALRWFMPRPDLALLFVASPAVIAERRPLYTAEYLEQVGQAYSRLTATFPELVVVNSDPDQQGHADVDRLVEEFLRR